MRTRGSGPAQWTKGLLRSVPIVSAPVAVIRRCVSLTRVVSVPVTAMLSSRNDAVGESER